MSFNRAMYDPCAYDKRLDESTSVLTYQLDPNKFYNCNECRIEFGVVGGNAVSRFEGNLVDLESDLRNQTRLYSQCPDRKFLPGTIVQGESTNNCKPGCSKTGLPCGTPNCRNDHLNHLPACQIVQYKPRPDNIGYDLNYPPCPKPVKSQRVKAARKAKKRLQRMGQVGLANY